MVKVFTYAFRILRIMWDAAGWLAVRNIFSKVYKSSLFPFLQVFILSQVIDHIQLHKTTQLGELAPYIIVYIGAAIVYGLVTTSMQQFVLDARVESHLEKMIITKLNSLDPQTFEQVAFQELLTQVEGSKGALMAQSDRVIGFLDGLIRAGTASVVLLGSNPLLVLLILVSSYPTFHLGNVSRDKLWPFLSTRWSSVQRISQYVKGLLSQDGTSKESVIFGTGPVLLKKTSEAQGSFFRDFSKEYDPFVAKVAAANLIEMAASIYAQYFQLRSLMDGAVGLGKFTLQFQQTLRLSSGTHMLYEQYSSMLMRIKTIERFYEFMDYRPTITSPLRPDAIPSLPNPATIEFVNVTFRYPGTDRDILKNFNAIIRSGEKIALVGENGAGKTTLIKLILRFYDVTEGEVRINGIHIAKINLRHWHHLVGALFQDFIKYQFTLKENVQFGNLKLKNDKKLILSALAKSGAKPFVSVLPEGVDQMVGKMFAKGVDLSGGQWQKLALARAFFRDAPLLILDEPTSSIDAKAEYEIFENVQKLQKGKTVIIISHRFSTVRNADRILVLHQGRIIEEGSHEQLMTKRGHYAELFEIQAKGYK
ncbi:MAG: ABC transporter ATP-binding protein [bacterium]